MFTQILAMRTDILLACLVDLPEIKIIPNRATQKWYGRLSKAGRKCFQFSCKRATKLTLNIVRKLNNSQRKAAKFSSLSGGKIFLNPKRKRI